MATLEEILTAEFPEYADEFFLHDPDFKPWGDSLASGFLGQWVERRVERDGEVTPDVRRAFARMEELIEHEDYRDAVIVGFFEYLMRDDWAYELAGPRGRDAIEGLRRGFDRLDAD
jgi:hypothetical protein